MTLEQIHADGLRALARELGPVGMVRFLQQFEEGRGDYTAERDAWLPQTDVAALAEHIRHERQALAPRPDGGGTPTV